MDDAVLSMWGAHGGACGAEAAPPCMSHENVTGCVHVQSTADNDNAERA